MLKLYLLALAFVMVNAKKKSISYTDCGSKGATITGVYADQCTEEPCTVHKGQDYTGRVTFTANTTSTTAGVVLHGRLGAISIRWPVTPADACKTTMTCPIQPGNTYTYPIKIYCPNIAPTADITTKWELRDDNNESIICFIVSLTIR